MALPESLRVTLIFARCVAPGLRGTLSNLVFDNFPTIEVAIQSFPGKREKVLAPPFGTFNST
jgi:hypothetical protein